MVEVAVVVNILDKLFKAWKESKEVKKVSIGVISPYAAQVSKIQNILPRKYDNLDGFSVKVKSVEGFQGGEEDIIIISTVRSNAGEYVDYQFSPQRTNVAITRARQSLWILGNEKALASSDSVWRDLISDARNRNCLFDVNADETLKKTIVAAKKELQQLDDFLDGNNILFRDAKWKVLFSDTFRKSFQKLNSSSIKKSILNVLLKLSSGWRPHKINVDSLCRRASMKQVKVEGLYIVCTVDVVKESNYIQVLKVWDVLPLDEIPRLAKQLDNIYEMYTDDYINRCKSKVFDAERKLEIPKSWPASEQLTRFRKLLNSEADPKDNLNPDEGRSYVKNTKVSESLLLMKFYSFSSGVANHLLSDHDVRGVNLPMQVTDEQMGIILFGKSSFIIGWSGTRKTTVLTMKLFEKEKSFQIASQGSYKAEHSMVGDEDEEVDSLDKSKQTVLRQLFVTVSSKLCRAVKQQVSHITSFACNLKSSEYKAPIDFDDADTTAKFNDIPDSFLNVPENKYPLVITFHKFLLMMDGTLGNSYFERFQDRKEVKEPSHGIDRASALQTLIKSKEVTYERFCSLYWPHFNAQITKKLYASRVFTEIISHIKGGLQAGEKPDGKLSRLVYSLLSESRVSTLKKEEREMLYNLFEDYEMMKSRRGEFDLSDLVNDIHHRVRSGNYEGDLMDFVYIDCDDLSS